MKNFKLYDYNVNIICDGKNYDADVDIKADDGLELYLIAGKSKVKFVEIGWNFESDENLLVLGDAWERSYGELEFKKLGKNRRYMPWYFMTVDANEQYCLGVKTQPNAFVSFHYDTHGVCAIIDCRNGSDGVCLDGRKLKLCTFVFEKYSGNAFENLHKFCKKMCDKPVLPKERIYGFNNWYYAYGDSSYSQIISDTKLLCSLAKGLDTKPFSMIDDGWQINSCKGPWIPNGKFGDMKALSDEIKTLGARPGIWFRPLYNDCIKGTVRNEYLDPTLPEVQNLIVDDLNRIRDWGYELLKHDFSTFDLFGDYGKDLDKTISKKENWHFSDRTKTNAEIVLDFYRLIRETCQDMTIIGCNTVPHLCAGIFEANRTGDDTSGREWERTVKMGVNTLAFRLAQNETFYAVDADCVGISGDNIPWDKNRMWLDLLSKSNTALFVSAKELTNAQKQDLAYAFGESLKPHEIRPLDWFDTKTPQKWLIDGENISYKW